MHILPNVLSKGNQTMKFHQLTEYNMRKNFLESHTENVVEKLFLLYAKLRAVEIYQNVAASHFLVPLIKLFPKTERGLEPASLSHFLNDFSRKKIYLLTSYELIRFHCLVAFRSLDNGQYVYYNCLLTRLFINQFLSVALLIYNILMVRATTTKATFLKMITKILKHSHENDCRNIRWE